MTEAVGQFAAIQGKTSVTPRAITQRASNDPRGQHPDFEQDQQQLQGNVATDNTQKVSEDSTDGIDAHEVAATALTGAVQAEEVSTVSEQLLETDAELKAGNSELPTESALPADDFSAIEGSLPEADAEILAKEDSQAGKSKTTIASYKNMIENVAEQLLPQTGMFNLTTAKVPKARTRKPKTEQKKPSLAEKVETDDADSDS